MYSLHAHLLPLFKNACKKPGKEKEKGRHAKGAAYLLCRAHAWLLHQSRSIASSQPLPGHPQEAADTYRSYQGLFQQPVDDFAALDAVAAQVEERGDVWHALLSLQQHGLDWTTGSIIAEDGTARLACPVLC